MDDQTLATLESFNKLVDTLNESNQTLSATITVLKEHNELLKKKLMEAGVLMLMVGTALSQHGGHIDRKKLSNALIDFHDDLSKYN
jgi:hypothetical protein